MLRWIVVLAVVLGGLTVASVALLYSGYSNGWMVKKRPIGDLSKFLTPHFIVERPQTGAGPFPVVLMFPGCGGLSPTYHGDWAKFFATQGYLGVVVDSFTPRGLDRNKSLSKICTGRILWGRERAGDVMAAIDAVSGLPGADPSRIVLFGQSHGAWSIMDLLAMDFEHKAPTNLYPRPDPALLARIQATVLLYPYCGTLSLSGKHAWARKVPSYMALAEMDTVVSTLACQSVAKKLGEAGVPMHVDVFPGAEHAFDKFPVPEEEIDWKGYNEDHAAQVRLQIAAYLRGLR